MSPPTGNDVTSINFSKSKMYYGNAFEVYTKNLTVLACLNNVYNGRRFDQFEKMTLKKYLTIDKANRANPFSANPLLAPFAGCLNSSLRNATHHQGARLDKRGVIHYRTGGTGALRQIAYKDYVVACNEITIFLAVLLIHELLLMQTLAKSKNPGEDNQDGKA